ncbi:MAG: hypothetical protein PHS66_06800 [Candidatus Omnitrophica bacterium]|nr:hypothetical protein [Candidatus Omnitrophota bacterium]
MNKKEIYEHLANIYLDASSKSSKKKHRFSYYPKTALGAFLIGSVMILGVGSFFAYSNRHHQNQSQSGETALFLYQGATKINFNFDPATKEMFALNLKHLDLSKYKFLGFSIRKTNPKDIISLRIEFTNRFNEKSEIYIKDIGSKWADHKISLSRFGRMEYWTQMKELAFSIEEWNAREKSGIVYLDNIRVLK